jgi:hypothetical protein
MMVNENIVLEVSKRRFTDVTGYARPMAGDLIFVPFSNSLMEIKYADADDMFYQLGKNYVWTISCSLFRNDSSSTFETGFTDIDNVNVFNDNAHMVEFADNDELETEGTAIICEKTEEEQEELNTFSADNPFGEY